MGKYGTAKSCDSLLILKPFFIIASPAKRNRDPLFTQEIPAILLMRFRPGQLFQNLFVFVLISDKQPDFSYSPYREHPLE